MLCWLLFSETDTSGSTETESTPETLPAMIRQRVSHGAEPKVYIRADKRVSYGRVLQVLGSVRSPRIENVAFLVNERSSPQLS